MTSIPTPVMIGNDHNDIELETRILGPKDGEVVILLHGFPECWATWRHQMTVLADAGYRVYVPNMRGYGNSSAPSAISAYHPDILVADIEVLRLHSGQNKIHLVGHDWGAIVAWLYAMQHANHLASLNILNVPHPRVFEKTLQSSARQLLKSWYVFFFQLPLLPEWLCSINGSWFFRRTLKKTSNKGSYSDEDIRNLVDHWQIPGRLKGMINYYRAAMRYRPKTSIAQKITVPTRILWGEHDLALSKQMAHDSMSYVNDGELTTYPDATHWLALDKPSVIADELLAHFKRHPVGM